MFPFDDVIMDAACSREGVAVGVGVGCGCGWWRGGGHRQPAAPDKVPSLYINQTPPHTGGVCFCVSDRQPARLAAHVVERTADCFMARWSAWVQEKCSAGII